MEITLRAALVVASRAISSRLEQPKPILHRRERAALARARAVAIPIVRALERRERNVAEATHAARSEEGHDLREAALLRLAAQPRDRAA